MTRKVAVMFSGGIDSSVVAATLQASGAEVHLLAFDDDSPNFKTRRIIALEQVAQHLGLYDRLKIIRTYRSEELRSNNDSFGFIPGYKLSMQIMCMAYAQKLGCTELHMGYNRENKEYAYTFKDELYENIQAAAELYNKIYDAQIEAVSLFENVSKASIIRKAQDYKFPFEKTISCRATRYGGLTHCGKCLPCKSRRQAFLEANVPDPTDYAYIGDEIEEVRYGKEGTIIHADAKIKKSEPTTRYFGSVDDALVHGAKTGDMITVNGMSMVLI